MCPCWDTTSPLRSEPETPAIGPDGSALVVTCSYNDRLSFEGDNYVALLYRLDN